MDANTAAIVGLLSTVILGILGYLLSRSIAQIDEDFKELWHTINEVADQVEENGNRITRLEERTLYRDR